MDMVSKVNGPALPKEQWIKVDQAPPEKNGSEKTLPTIERRLQQTAGYSVSKKKKNKK